MPSDNEPQIPRIQSQIIDERSGFVARDWYRFFLNLLNKAESGGGGGTVTSVNVSGGTTGLSASGGPVTTSGTITLGGALNVSNGGTGAINAANARINLDVPQTDGTNATGTWAISVTGNANTVTNGVYTTGSYADPTWITSLAGSKITGNISGQAGSVANALTAGTGISYSVGTTYNGSTAITINNSAPDQIVSLTGGTGISTSGTYPSFTITNTAPDQVVSLTAGTGMSVTGTYPSFTLTNTAPDQVVSLTGAGTTSISGTYPNFTITSNDQYVGTVTSVSGTGTVNGISLSGTVTSSGSLTLGGTLSNVSLTTQVTGTLPIANGGSGQTTAQAAMNAFAGAVTSGQYLRGNGTNVVMSAIQAADVPTLNQNTTGTASNVTGVVAIANGGTGQTTASAAFNALSPITSIGDLILGNGTNSATRLPIGSNNFVLTSNGTTATWAAPTGATITNDTSTSTNVYPTFAAATSGALSTIYTSNAKLLYKPSTGELTSSHVVASNGIFVNSLTIATSYTIPAGSSGMSAGVISVSNGVTVTVSNGSRWVVV